MKLEVFARFARPRGGLAFLGVSGSNHQRQMRPKAAFCMRAGGGKLAFQPIRLHTEMPHQFGAASALLIA